MSKVHLHSATRCTWSSRLSLSLCRILAKVRRKTLFTTTAARSIFNVLFISSPGILKAWVCVEVFFGLKYLAALGNISMPLKYFPFYYCIVNELQCLIILKYYTGHILYLTVVYLSNDVSILSTLVWKENLYGYIPNCTKWLFDCYESYLLIKTLAM